MAFFLTAREQRLTIPNPSIRAGGIQPPFSSPKPDVAANDFARIWGSSHAERLRALSGGLGVSYWEAIDGSRTRESWFGAGCVA